MGLFEKISYSEGLLALVVERRERGEKVTYSQLAAAARIQPSYLTNVLKGRAHLSQDQLYSIGEHLQLNEEEADYLLLLLEHERTIHPKRKRLLETKLEQKRSQQRRTEKQLAAKPVELSPSQLEQYYLDPFVILTHIYLGFHPDKESPARISERFGVSPKHMERILRTLEQIGYVERTRDSFVVKKRGMHLAKDSPIAGPHLALMRMKAIDQLQRLEPSEKYSFSATISTSPDARDKIQAAFVDFLKKAEKLVQGDEGKEMYQINFDLFPWGIGVSGKD